MIEYNRSSWWKTVFTYRGTALRQVRRRLLGVILWALFIQFIYEEGSRFQWGDVTNIIDLDTAGHVVLGSVLGFLIVFRMNASNARYWEGRSHWGMLINSTRSIVRYAAVYAGKAEELANLVGGYVVCLRQSLRGSRDMAEAELFLPPEVLEQAQTYGNPPSAVAAAISEWIAARKRSGALDPMDVRQMEELLMKMVDSQGGCEKIQKTPLPFVYAAMIKQLILLYICTLPLVLCQRCGWWTPLMVGAVSFGFLGIEEASVEIEDPFGLDDNCLDLETYCLTVSRDTAQLAEHIPGPESS